MSSAECETELKRKARAVPDRELAIALVLELAVTSTQTFSPLAFYDDDVEFMEALAERCDVNHDQPFKNKVVKVCRHLVHYGVVYARMRGTAKEYLGEPSKQQEYTLRPGKAHLLTKEARPGITYGPRGEAEWLLRHAYPAQK